MHNFIYVSNTSKIQKVNSNSYFIDNNKITECNLLIKNIENFLSNNKIVNLLIDNNTIIPTSDISDNSINLYNLQCDTNIELLICATAEYIYFLKIKNNVFKMQKKIPYINNLDLSAIIRITSNNLVIFVGTDIYIVDYSLKIYKFKNVLEYELIKNSIILIIEQYDYFRTTVDLDSMIPKNISYIDKENIINLKYDFYLNSIKLEYNDNIYETNYLYNFSFTKLLKKKDFYNVDDCIFTFSDIKIKIEKDIIVQDVPLKLNKSN